MGSRNNLRLIYGLGKYNVTHLYFLQHTKLHVKWTDGKLYYSLKKGIVRRRGCIKTLPQYDNSENNVWTNALDHVPLMWNILKSRWFMENLRGDRNFVIPIRESLVFVWNEPWNYEHLTEFLQYDKYISKIHL